MGNYIEISGDKPFIIYYDNPTPASDLYLKMLKKDAEERGITLNIITDTHQLLALVNTTIHNNYNLPFMALEPTQCRFADFVNRRGVWQGLENVDGSEMFPSATATGIACHIGERYPDRSNAICVIGRGKVGNPLVNMLIKDGYTVVNTNSRTPATLLWSMVDRCKIIVGLANQDNILDMSYYFRDKWYIDASHNFTFTGNAVIPNVDRCGKWTREVIFKRVEQILWEGGKHEYVRTIK